MIQRIEFNGESVSPDDPPPLAAGEAGRLSAWGEDPLTVQIKCISGYPPPPRLSPCAQCGTYRIRSGDAVTIIAPPDAYGGRKNIEQTDQHYLAVQIADSANDTITLNFGVRVRAYAYADVDA